ncbi:Thermonuclease precursor [compost metagenome]
MLNVKVRSLLGGLLTAALLALPLPATGAPALQGKVVKVSDGDTLVVQVDPNRQEKVRLVGIDTPEMAQKPWGERAKVFTERLALGKVVRLETDVQPRDQYGRLLAYAYVGKTFINYELVRQGYAMLLTYPPNVAHVDEFTQAQKQARQEGKGIWNSKDGLEQSPRDFRREKRNGGGTGSSADRATDRPPANQDAPRTKAPNASAGSANSKQAKPEGANPAGAPPTGAASVIANGKSRIYHDSSCPSGASIGAANRLVLPSAADAQAKGFTACKRCGG